MSKIGLQSQSGTISEMGKLLDKKPIAWMLLGNALNVGVGQYIRDRSPSTLILLRTGPDWAYQDPAWTIDYANDALAKAAPFQKRGLCDFLLPPNEPVVRNDVEARQLNERQVYYANRVRAAGYRTGAYCFSVGNPDYPLWKYLQDGIRACDGWLFLHEYGIPGQPQGDFTLRHRKVKPLIAPDIDLKIGITECLIDLGADRSVYGHAGGYRSMPENGRLMEDHLDYLAWWDREIAKDDYLKFATLYGYAMEQPWVGYGFDVANVNEDRDKFIAWFSGGTYVESPPVPIVTPPYTGRVPFAGGYRLTQAYGANPAYYAGLNVGLASHEGADLIPLDADWTIHAIEPGTVVLRSTIGNYGNHVVIWNPATARLWWYCHLESFVAAMGQPIVKGQPIGVMGKSGNAQGAHLHLGLQMADAAGKSTNTNNGNLGYIDPLPALEGTIGEPLMSTPQERINANWNKLGIDYLPTAALSRRAKDLGLGRPVTNEDRYVAADGKKMAYQGFSLAMLECVEGDWGNIQAYDWLTGEPWTAPVNVPPVGQPPQVGGVMAYAFPQALTDIGAMGVEGQRVPGSPFYRIAGASVRRGISALMVATVIGKGGTPVIGAKVVNQFPDGNGEIVETDGSGNARFQFGASSAFTNPGSGPFTLFVADVSAFKDSDSSPKRVVFKNKLSDTVKSLGDYQAEHTEIYLQFVEQPS